MVNVEKWTTLLKNILPSNKHDLHQWEVKYDKENDDFVCTNRLDLLMDINYYEGYADITLKIHLHNDKIANYYIDVELSEDAYADQLLVKEHIYSLIEPIIKAYM